MSGGVTRATRLLPLAIVAAAIALFASELMTTFEFTPPGGEAICDVDGSDRHGNALIVIAVFAVLALAVSIYTGSKPAAIAVAAAGGLSLLVFLLLDLPDANAVGTIDDTCGSVASSFFDAEAVPQGGFFLEMVGALALTATGVALATLTPEQLAMLWPGGGPLQGSGGPGRAGTSGRPGATERRSDSAIDPGSSGRAEGEGHVERRPPDAEWPRSGAERPGGIERPGGAERLERRPHEDRPRDWRRR